MAEEWEYRPTFEDVPPQKDAREDATEEPAGQAAFPEAEASSSEPSGDGSFAAELAELEPQDTVYEAAGSPTPSEEGGVPVSAAYAEASAAAKRPLRAGDVARGIAGALLGALVGAVPWFLMSTFGLNPIATFINGFLNNETAVYVIIYILTGLFGAVIGLGAFYGYRLLRGARRRGALFGAVGGASLLSVLLVNYASLFFLYWQYFMNYLAYMGYERQAGDTAMLVKTCAAAALQVMVTPDILFLIGLTALFCAGTLLLLKKPLRAYAPARTVVTTAALPGTGAEEAGGAEAADTNEACAQGEGAGDGVWDSEADGADAPLWADAPETESEAAAEAPADGISPEEAAPLA